MVDSAEIGSFIQRSPQPVVGDQRRANTHANPAFRRDLTSDQIVADVLLNLIPNASEAFRPSP
jgi:hypothetical protein